MTIRVGVVGAGSWGTTIAALTVANTPTMLWCRRAALAAMINDQHCNPDYLGSFALPENLRATASIEEVAGGSDVVVMAVPSHGFREVLESAAPYVRPWVPIVSLTKGLEQTTLKRMSEVVNDLLPGHPVAVLTGPNLAREILAGQPAASVVAIADAVIATELQRIFATPRLRIYTNPDMVGCEVSGVMKNVMAIASGMADGMGFGDNTRATLITRGLAEMTRLGVALGGDVLTFAGLAGMGDLIATCSSGQSRNHMVGHALGTGRSIEEIVADMRMVAEGVKSSPSVLDLGRRHHVDLPLTEQVVAVCHEGRTAKEAVAALMQRELTAEGRGMFAPVTVSADVGTVIGVTGTAARAWVTQWGGVRFDDGSHLDWWIAADDRWHVPSAEPSVQQRLIDGTPVVETTVRVPRGDVQQRVYGAVGGDGLVVLELENRSRLPVAVVLNRRDVLSARAAVAVPAGMDTIDLPADAASYPLGHAAVIRLAVPLGRRPEPVVSLPTARQVAQGWRRRVELGPRLIVPDDALRESLVSARCRVLLEELPPLADDPVAAIVMASERHRLREPLGLDAADIASAVARWARARRRDRQVAHQLAWTDAVMLERAAELLDAAAERRGADDARQLLARRPGAPPPADPPRGPWLGPWLERALVMPKGDEIELLAGLPASWFGQAVEAHDVPVGRDRVGFALRWHGARPALLWECSAPRRLVCPRLDASWASDQARGEALLRPPVG